MKTYIWAEDYKWNAFEYEFIAVMAESLEDARKLAIEELSKTYFETSAKCQIVNTTIPIVLEPNTALLIDHANY
jgi:hypothetical protein